MELRLAEADELGGIEPLGREFFEESGYPGRLDFEAWRESWETLLDAGMGFILVLDDGGKFRGFLSALVMPDPFNGVTTVAETSWFVSSSHRRGLAPMRLLWQFEEEGKARGAKRFVMSHLAKLTPERLTRMFEKRGYKLHEQTFVKELH